MTPQVSARTAANVRALFPSKRITEGGYDRNGALGVRDMEVKTSAPI